MKRAALLACSVLAGSLAMPGAAYLPGARDGSSAPAAHEMVRPLTRDRLPNIPGKELIAVEVDFPPGAAALPHRHPPSAFVYAYVLSGEVLSALGQEEARPYRAGESFHEEPGTLHRVTRNASATRPARLLVIFIANAGESHLVTPVPIER